MQITRVLFSIINIYLRELLNMANSTKEQEREELHKAI